MAKRRYRRNRRKRNKVSVPRSMVSYNGIKNFKLRAVFPVVLNATGNIDLHFNVNSLSQAATLSNSPIALQEYGSLIALFDQYKVKGVRIKWIPTVTPGNQELPGPGAASFYGLQPSLIMAYDPDNIGNIAPGAMVTRDRVKFRQPWRQFTHYQKVKKGYQKLASPVAGVNLLGGWMNCQEESKHLGGVVVLGNTAPFLNGAGQPLTGSIGTVILTTYLQTKIRQ